MSLDRPDIKYRLDPAYHTALKRICDARGMTLAEFTERLMEREIRLIVHEASLVAQSAADLGIAGNSRESAGTGGKR